MAIRGTFSRLVAAPSQLPLSQVAWAAQFIAPACHTEEMAPGMLLTRQVFSPHLPQPTQLPY